MPREKPIIPYGIPNPIGPAVFEGVRNKSRIGGQLPKEKYPLICGPAIAFNKNESVMGTKDFQRLAQIVRPITNEDPDPYQQRLERLREESKQLQMGWCDSKKDVVKQLAEKFLMNTQKDKDIQEMAQREQIAKQKPKQKQSWPLTVTGNNERLIALEKGLLLTEVTSQRKENERIAKDYRALCQQREIEEHENRQRIIADLNEKQSQREQHKKQYLKNVETFQKIQEDKKKKDQKEAKDSFNKERRAFCNGLQEDAQAKAYKEAIDDKNLRSGRGQEWLLFIEKRKQEKQDFNLLEDDLLKIADLQTEEYHQRSVDDKVRKYQRSVRIGARQQKAAQHYQETVLDKIVDKEDEEIALFEAKEEQLYQNAMSKHAGKKSQLKQDCLHFEKGYQKRKQNQYEFFKQDKAEHGQVLEEKFMHFLKESEQKESKRLSYEKEITNFWAKQVNEKKQNKIKRKQADADFQEGVKFREAVDEDSVERQAQELLAIQQSLGRETYPIQQCKDALNLGKGAPVVASDGNYDNRVYSVTKDIFYKPIDSRNRLSINWDPTKTVE